MATRQRTQFSLPPQTLRKLDRLKSCMGASSRTEVLKIAIELLSWAVAHLSKGEEIAAVRAKRVLETIALPAGDFTASRKDGADR